MRVRNMLSLSFRVGLLLNSAASAQQGLDADSDRDGSRAERTGERYDEGGHHHHSADSASGHLMETQV